MKGKVLLIIAAVLAVATFVAAVPSYAGEGYVGVEFYPDGNPYIYGGKNPVSWIKVTAWAIPPSEVGLTLGPKIGPFELGFGYSAGLDTTGKVQPIFTNYNLAFCLNLKEKLFLQSYNIFQHGNKGIDDFTLSNQWIWVNGFPLGVMGHNIKVGSKDTQYFWGPLYKFGSLGPFSSFSACAAADVQQGGSYWAILTLEF